MMSTATAQSEAKAPPVNPREIEITAGCNRIAER